ncbi:MAG: hypothetical protein EOO89_16675 [Pedobacter sp.]|nr:MAG: hypothetical protein EOO89_16675 [Pedobacter sp.]
MRNVTVKLSHPLLCIALLSIIMYGCKKTEIKTQALSAEKLAIFKEQIKKEGQVTTYLLNKKATAYTSDANGEPITTKLMGTNKLLGECYDGDNLPIPFDDLNLVSVKKLYDCAKWI